MAVPKARVVINKAKKGWQRYLPRSRGHRACLPPPHCLGNSLQCIYVIRLGLQQPRAAGMSTGQDAIAGSDGGTVSALILVNWLADPWVAGILLGGWHANSR